MRFSVILIRRQNFKFWDGQTDTFRIPIASWFSVAKQKLTNRKKLNNFCFEMKDDETFRR